MKKIQFTTRSKGRKSCQSAALFSAQATTMKWFSILAVSIGLTASAAFGQALPAAEASPISTGFALPLTAGTLQYALSASESLYWGYYNTPGTVASTNVSGDVAYISSSKRDPFSMVFSGGRSTSTSNQQSYTFLDLSLSQVVNVGRWGFVLSDYVSYLPSTSIGSLSGVAGTGNVGIQVGANTGQGVLTNYSSRVYNTAALSVQRQVTGKTSIDGSGSYSIIHFLDNTGSSVNSGLDSYSAVGSGGLTHQISPRTSFGGRYSYSVTDFSGPSFGVPESTITTQVVSGQVTRHVTRKLVVTADAGPEWTTANSPATYTSLGVFASVGADYTAQFSESSLNYSRGTNSGYGVVGGSESDSVTFSYARTFARVWHGSLTGAFTRTQNLPLPGIAPYNFHTTVAAAQISRAIARSLSCYVSYTAENQSTSGSVAGVDVFSGLTQVVSFGLTFSPASKHVGHP